MYVYVYIYIYIYMYIYIVDLREVASLLSRRHAGTQGEPLV